MQLLEGLDEEIKIRRKIQTDLELAKADREQLLNHYERERELRRKAEERHLNVEDELDLDKPNSLKINCFIYSVYYRGLRTTRFPEIIEFCCF